VNNRKVGSWYERLAREYVKKNGGRIVATNYRLRNGEIDIIAYDDSYLCFIEVKYRKDKKYGGPEAAVNLSKQKKICKTSLFYLYSQGLSEDIPIRYDVICVSGEQESVSVYWHKNSFDFI
jgi:putative endonuclease